MQAQPKTSLRSSKRPNKEAYSNKKSRYEFHNFVLDGDNNRVPRLVLDNKDKADADLICTAFYNPSTRTYTAHTIALDLDFDRADWRWKEEGRVSEQLILSFLEQECPEIHKAISEAALSSSGRGLGIAIPISPFELSEGNEKLRKLAGVLQLQLIKIFNFYGMGADVSARGVKKLMPNFKNEKKLVYRNEIRRRTVDIHGLSVLSELLTITNAHPAMKEKKSELTDVLHSHAPTEKKLIGFYEYLIDEALEGSVYLSFSEVEKLTGLSRSTLYNKVLKNSLGWVQFNHVSKADGYEIIFYPSQEKSRRVAELKEGYDRHVMFSMGEVIRPEGVKDDNRNHWLTNLILSLKHKGVGEDKTLEIVAELVGLIPGFEDSRTVKNSQKIVRSIFSHQLDLFGCREEMSLPRWLQALISNASRECSKKPKKGGLLVPSFREEEEPLFYSQGVEGDTPPLSKGDFEQQLRKEAQVVNPLIVAVTNGYDAESFSSVPQSALQEMVISLHDYRVAAKGEAVIDEQVKKKVSLKKSRQRAFGSIDPIDRFLTAFGRCLYSCSEEKILDVLVNSEAGYRETRTFEGDKVFNRVQKAYFAMPERVRFSVLENIKDLE